jgi:hypothetical protein
MIAPTILNFADAGIPLQIIDGTWTNGHFQFDPDGEDKWAVRLAGTSREGPRIGEVYWFGVWKRGVRIRGFYALRMWVQDVALAPECLDDIAQFCRDRGAERAARLRNGGGGPSWQ